MVILVWQVRNKYNITLNRLSQMTGISKSTLNRIENSQTSPTLGQMEKIAKALNVKISDLFTSDYK